MSHGTKTKGGNMRRRIKKKKGLLRDPEYEKIRACWIRELEQEMKILEELADKKERKIRNFFLN